MISSINGSYYLTSNIVWGVKGEWGPGWRLVWLGQVKAIFLFMLGWVRFFAVLFGWQCLFPSPSPLEFSDSDLSTSPSQSWSRIMSYIPTAPAVARLSMVVTVGVVRHRPDYHHILFTVSFSACGYWSVLHSKGLQGLQESGAGEGGMLGCQPQQQPWYASPDSPRETWWASQPWVRGIWPSPDWVLS